MFTNYRFSIYSSVFFFAAAIAFTLAYWIYARRKREAAKYLVFAEIAIGWWSLAIAFETAALTPELKFLWSKIAYPGTTYTLLGYFLFAASYSQNKAWLRPRWVILLAVIPTLINLAAFTNDWHHLLWPGLTIDPITNIAVYQHGPIFLALVAFSYTILALGLGMLFRGIILFPAYYGNQIGAIILGALTPFLGNLIYLMGINPIPGLDWSIIGFLLSGGILAYAVNYLGLLNLLPLARSLVIDTMREGMLIVDQSRLIADLNPSAESLLGLQKEVIGRPAAEVLPPLGILLPAPEDTTPRTSEVRLQRDQDCYLEVTRTPIKLPGQGVNGLLLTFHEVTHRRQAEKTLQEMNRTLETMVEERTAQLLETIYRLEEEVRSRSKVEAELEGLRDSLVDRIAEQSRQLSAVYDVILFSGQSTDLQQIFHQTLEKVCGLFHGKAACIHQQRDVGGPFSLVAQTGMYPDQLERLSSLPASWLNDQSVSYVSVELAQDANLPEALRLDTFASLITSTTHLRGAVTGSLTIFWAERHALPINEIALFTAMADHLGIVIENIRLHERIEQTAVQKERRRLARDLHDSVTQSLHSLVLAADTANNRLGQGKIERMGESLAHMAESARQAIKDMRLLLYELRLVKLEEIQLAEAIETRLDSVERRAGIRAEVVADEEIEWPPGWQGETYTIIMEALNNSLKYARAAAITVRVQRLSGQVRVTVQDDGKGFDPARVGSGGMGLKNMAERAERIGGKLEVTSSPGSGACVALTLDPGSYQKGGVNQ